MLQVAENPGFDVCRASIDYLTQQIREIEQKLEGYKQAGLPQQLIHGDLHVRGRACCHVGAVDARPVCSTDRTLSQLVAGQSADCAFSYFLCRPRSMTTSWCWGTMCLASWTLR